MRVRMTFVSGRVAKKAKTKTKTRTRTLRRDAETLPRDRSEPTTRMSGGDDAAASYDHLVKILLVGDSGVGKSSLLMRFIEDSFEEVSPTVGVDFKLKMMTVDGKRLKLTVWDTAGQERFRTLTSSYYRGAHGVIFVYDIANAESFANVEEVWRKEVDMYSTISNGVKMIVGNKVDKESSREIAKEDGVRFAKEHGCLFLECSAKTRTRVQEAFDELVKGILETPGLLADAEAGPKVNVLGAYDEERTSGCC